MSGLMVIKLTKYVLDTHTLKTSNQNVISNIIQHSDWTILEYKFKTCIQKFYECDARCLIQTHVSFYFIFLSRTI